MLKLSYRTASLYAPPQPSESATLFGVAALGVDLCVDLWGEAVPTVPHAAVFMPAFNQGGLIEAWLSADIAAGGADNKACMLSGGRCGALSYRHSEQMLFGSIALDDASFPAVDDRTGLQQATATAYQQIFELLDRLSFPALWRVWNFIPRINVVEHGSERYRQFNSARQQAFVRCGRTITGSVPAASALGSASGPLTIYFFAGRYAAQPIENPRQLSAYHYPREYGEKSPTFARASLVSLAGQEVLFVSGTASIVGHNTLHEHDVAAQTRELMINIEAVLSEANAAARQRRFSMQELVYKVYIRRREDYSIVVAEMQKSLGILPVAVYLQADICRADLLVEVEASGGHPVEMAIVASAEEKNT
jgi:enamine deaminase RidA (YjgF/YER057c/UK114 family)